MNTFFLNIYEHIQGKIQKEIFVSGQKISETALMKEYGCSRAQIRIVISWCVFNDILEVRPKSGTYVKVETQKTYRDKLEVRAYLEKLACRIIIEKASDIQINSLYSYVTKMDDELRNPPCNLKKFSRIHYNFHYSLIKLTKNKYLINAFLNLNLKYSYLFAEGAHTDIRVLFFSNDEHMKILDAIKDRNIVLAEKYVDEHLWQHKSIPSSIY